MSDDVVYVLGTESSGKTDLVQQLEYLSHGKLRTVPTKCTPTTGQEVTELTLSHHKRAAAARTTVEVRELGGSVVNTWESFIIARKAKNGTASSSSSAAEATRFFLLFVVDSTAPQQLPLASSVFRCLTTGGEATCAGWPALVVLQKSACVGAMSREDVAQFFFDGEAGDARAAGAADSMLDVDSWNGLGLGDVLRWLDTVTVPL